VAVGFGLPEVLNPVVMFIVAFIGVTPDVSIGLRSLSVRFGKVKAVLVPCGGFMK
jgi:hypothetical protein